MIVDSGLHFGHLPVEAACTPCLTEQWYDARESAIQTAFSLPRIEEI